MFFISIVRTILVKLRHVNLLNLIVLWQMNMKPLLNPANAAK
jgi:hypothetical protein